MIINSETLPELDAECKAYSVLLRSQSPREQYMLGMLKRLIEFGGVIEIKLATGEHHHWGFEDSLSKLMNELAEPTEDASPKPKLNRKHLP